MQKSRSELVFDHAIKHATPFSTTLGHAWVVVPEGHTRSFGWPIFSRRFREWLAHSFSHEHGLYAGCHAMDSALTMLAAHARYSEIPAGEIFTRIGWRGDSRRPQSVLLHLANANNELIEITPDSQNLIDSWQFQSSGPGLLSAQPWHFLVDKDTAPLPHPVNNATTPLLHQLHEVLGLHGLSLTRALVWLFATLRPTGPYPVLVLTGPAATGKSTLARAIRALIDPSGTPLQGAPSSEHDLFAAALHNHILAFDHIDRFHPYVAGAIARLATGTGYAIYRRNIFDAPESLALARPIVVTAPELPAAFAGNSMRIHLDGKRPHILNEFDLGHAIETAAASILGSLCAAVSCALRNSASTDAKSPSRFADVHHWTMSAASALGLTPDQINHALAASPLTDAVAALLESTKEWSGTATDLLAALDKVGYPRLASTPRALSEQLNITPLALFGIRIEKEHTGHDRQIHLTQTPDSCVSNFPASQIRSMQ